MYMWKSTAEQCDYFWIKLADCANCYTIIWIQFQAWFDLQITKENFMFVFD